MKLLNRKSDHLMSPFYYKSNSYMKMLAMVIGMPVTVFW